MTIPELLEELESLRDSSYQRSKIIIDNGEMVSDVYRAKAEGYTDAYSYCIFRLKQLKKVEK